MDEADALRAEVEHYKTEKEKIRGIVGQIGGKPWTRQNFLINGLFLLLVLAAFVFDVVRSALKWDIPYLKAPIILEAAVLLVSLKIIWMIHTRTKVDHFQFWMLSSIEFRLNMLSRRVNDVKETLNAMHNPSGPPDTNDEPSARDRA